MSKLLNEITLLGKQFGKVTLKDRVLGTKRVDKKKEAYSSAKSKLNDVVNNYQHSVDSKGMPFKKDSPYADKLIKKIHSGAKKETSKLHKLGSAITGNMQLKQKQERQEAKKNTKVGE